MKQTCLLATMFLAVGVAWASQPATAPTVELRVLSAELANRIAVRAMQSCAAQGYRVAAAVVDRTGNLQALVRHPLAGAHTVEVSRRKAYAAATFQTATGEIAARAGLQPLNSTTEVLILGGGLPVRVAGHFYGGVGVSGAPAKEKTGDRDEACAAEGIAAVREELEFLE